MRLRIRRATGSTAARRGGREDRDAMQPDASHPDAKQPAAEHPDAKHPNAARTIPWTPQDFDRHLDGVVEVYRLAMGYASEVLYGRRAYMAEHARRPGFRAVASLDERGSVLGFGYGYPSTPGQWWHDQVRAAIPRPQRAGWLEDCFEVVELHVRPSAQGHGLGATQLRMLLEMATARTVLLSTPEADERQSRAWRLYRRFGFVDVLRHFRFPGDARPFGILGRTLPLPPG